MPSLSHSPLASYNTKKLYKKYTFDIFVNVKFILSFTQKGRSDRNAFAILRLAKDFRSDRPFLRYFKF